ncbi:hypothetical protein [Tautonia plasticadhaerens]|uniref:Uncharacterized protein n=1 Tax=Tautonia plasticadhaerens TaxID=2527974 RepID=A0A518HEL3_9BACT|nr:hypothetical protein [Tautonia plasticadhaerens]QDV39271.1 hypothetical protein ElP_72350 [Tautonia plasticadhaerens]
MPFVRGESYTREHIHAELGGETVSYLPQRAGRVVCGCFSQDSNREAPYEILVGGSDEEGVDRPILKKARQLAKQGGPIPVFLKQGPNAWMYDGHYRVKGVIEDRSYLEGKQRRAGRTDVALALLLEPVEAAHDTYLLTWNPGNWQWDDLEDWVLRTAEGRPVEDR